MAEKPKYTTLPIWIPDWLRQKGLRQQDVPRQGYVHITSRKTYMRAESKKLPPLKYLGYHGMLKPGNSFSHYAIDPWGVRGLFAPEHIQAWSQGWGKYGGKIKLISRTRAGELVIPDWWNDAWLGKKSVIKDHTIENLGDMLYPDVNSPNTRSFSCEFIQWNNQYLLTEAQYISGHELFLEVCARNGIPFAHPFVLGHEDVDPFKYPPGRGDKHGGWDPGARRAKPRFCWTCFFTNNFHHDGSYCKCVLPTPEQPIWAKM